jgi:predicted AAA+ superfamily ATPase
MITVEEIKSAIRDREEAMDRLFSTERIITREQSKIEKYFYPGIANIITGVRRCGKSVLAFQLAKRGNFGYVNFEDERLSMSGQELNKVLEAIYSLKGEVEVLVFDEIQNIPGWEKFVTRILPAKKVLITGNNARLMSRELATYLTGRHIDFTLFPFSFREFLKYQGMEIRKEDLYSTRTAAKLKDLFMNYLETGGFPETMRLGRLFLLENFRDIVERDVIQRYRPKYSSKLKELAKYLVSNPSCEMTYSKLRKIFSLGSVNTIAAWISYLENSYLAFKLERFSPKLKEAMLAPKKFFSIDTGLSNAVGFRVTENVGKAMENLVAVELLRRRSYWNESWEIFYWKDYRQREVDFVIKEGVKVKKLIQVCREVNVENREREVGALLAAMKEFGLKEGLILTFDQESEEKINNKVIKYTPLWKWLLEVVED